MRINDHPIVRPAQAAVITFTFEGRLLEGREGETIASALFANGQRVFGRHPRDGAPQGLFCANGQCAQCLVIADGKPVKACMTPVRAGMRVEPLSGLPVLPQVPAAPATRDVVTVDVAVLILGGGPAGLSAAIELGRMGIHCLIVDDKDRLGGKLVLQTHRFFGSINAVYAGTRGIDIATRLANEVRALESLDVWLDSTALAVFSDGKVGVLRSGSEYAVVRPQVLLVATGAREKSLTFKGNTLPGVYGAGAFQTLVNRDLVRAADRLFIVGGGNVGLIAGYHALQAGIQVAGLCEALSECGGYKVHKDKLVRMGVPMYTSHTVLSANGDQQVESVTIAAIDRDWQPMAGTERTFACDTLLVAVGLDPVNEFALKASEYGLPVFSAGDAEEIAEASSAMFQGRIRGLEIARRLGGHVSEIPGDWYRTAEILKSHPGAVEREHYPNAETGVVPILHCTQEIPCNPCTAVCPQGLIHVDEDDIRHMPQFMADAVGKVCVGCEKCVTVCPGLAITLVDYRKDASNPQVTIPMEFGLDHVHVGDSVTVLDTEGQTLGSVEVTSVRAGRTTDRTVVVKVRAPAAWAKRIAGIRVQEQWIADPLPEAVERLTDDAIVCRCERVTAGEIRALIRIGYRDVNEIKTMTRAGLGACGSKTCAPLIQRLFREEGIPAGEVTLGVRRPLFVEVPLGTFAGVREDVDA